jgi:carboxyl-terminal processing protease
MILMNAIIQFMKRHYKILLIVVVLSVGLWSFMPKLSVSDPEKDKTLIELLTFVLEKGHYDPAVIDDSFSKQVYAEYINSLDPSKRFLLQSDIDEFAKYETRIDDAIRNKDLTFFDLTYNRLVKRMNESKDYYKSILEKPFDYSVNEEISTDYDNIPYASNIPALRERWRKQLKLSSLSYLVDKQDTQEEIAKNAGKSQQERLAEYKAKMGSKFTPELEKKFLVSLEKEKNETPKSFEKLESEARESSLKSLNDYFDLVKDLERNDWFAVFLNAIVERFDPHTTYFPAEDKERFDISMSGKLEGIGARLQKKNDYTEISELISGGPAWRGKELEAGDVVLKVAQGDAEPVDVVGMRLDDVVKKIKGPKGTEVRLTVKRTDGSVRVISIIRDEVEMEETYARSSIVEKEGAKYGIIYLPKFYIDFENNDSRDAAKDVAIEVEKLKTANVKGIIIDVRDNGGGSLKTVVDIGGLFIDQGPIVQVKTAEGKREVLYDRDKKIAWDGPLVIMTNSFSASASEILAAAMQDYKRAVIIGGKQTFGKGTVQNVIDLNQFVRGSAYGDLGALKTTTQKFYRINGGSTQLEGVASDVVMPNKFAYLKMGERDEKNAMPWDKIDPADYKLWDKQSNHDKAIANSKKRLENNAHLKLIDENAKWIDQRDNQNTYSLEINSFKKEQKQIEEAAKKFKAIADYSNSFKFQSLPYEQELMLKDEALKEKRESWHESLSKDIYVEEAIHVLDDLQTGSTKKPASAKLKKQKTIKS